MMNIPHIRTLTKISYTTYMSLIFFFVSNPFTINLFHPYLVSGQAIHMNAQHLKEKCYILLYIIILIIVTHFP